MSSISMVPINWGEECRLQPPWHFFFSLTRWRNQEKTRERRLLTESYDFSSREHQTIQTGTEGKCLIVTEDEAGNRFVFRTWLLNYDSSHVRPLSFLQKHSDLQSVWENWHSLIYVDHLVEWLPAELQHARHTHTHTHTHRHTQRERDTHRHTLRPCSRNGWTMEDGRTWHPQGWGRGVSELRQRKSRDPESSGSSDTSGSSGSSGSGERQVSSSITVSCHLRTKPYWFHLLWARVQRVPRTSRGSVSADLGRIRAEPYVADKLARGAAALRTRSSVAHMKNGLGTCAQAPHLSDSDTPSSNKVRITQTHERHAQWTRRERVFFTGSDSGSFHVGG